MPLAADAIRGKNVWEGVGVTRALLPLLHNIRSLITGIQVLKVTDWWERKESDPGRPGQCRLAHIGHKDLCSFLPSALQGTPLWCFHTESFHGLALLLARQKRNMWSMQMPTHTAASNYLRNNLCVENVDGERPNTSGCTWSSGSSCCYKLGWGGLHERLFLNKYGSKQRFYENEYHRDMTIERGENPVVENAAVVSAVRHSSFSLAVGTLTPFSAIRLCWCKVVGIEARA